MNKEKADRIVNKTVIVYSLLSWGLCTVCILISTGVI
jgi:hypothetical protein